MTLKKEIYIEIPENKGGGEPNSQFFYRNPQYAIRAIPTAAYITQTPIRILYEGPTGSAVSVILVKPGHTNRITCLSQEVPVIQTPEVIILKEFN